MICGDSDTSSDESKQFINFFIPNSLLILFLIIGINIIQQNKINKGPQTGMTEQTVVNNISDPQFTELNNINLSPSTSSENVSLNMAISRSFNIPEVNKLNIIFSYLNNKG